MREKELRLALICYGGISLAVYMHGITKEAWHLARASRAYLDGTMPEDSVEAAYRDLLTMIEDTTGTRLRVLPDIIAGASAGGINGIFLAQAIATGQSLDPLTALWLDNADIDALLDPAARAPSRISKLWASPLAWAFAGRQGHDWDDGLDEKTRDEIFAKLTRFVRSRWFEPPFGGEAFDRLLLDAFEAMAQGQAGPRLLPDDQPLDLFVTVTDFNGHPEDLPIHSPPMIVETEHRMTLSFRDAPGDPKELGDVAELVFAARATASFPGAFPPFTVGELDRVLASRKRAWPGRADFLSRILPPDTPAGAAEATVLIDGSVLANAPFSPAIEALRDRPARREVDRRFVYIDPKPGHKSIGLNSRGSTVPGFFTTLFGALSDIPRTQPIRDNIESIAGRSARIARTRRIVEALRPDVETSVETLFGRTMFLDRPTQARLALWRSRAAERAARDAGHSFIAYREIVRAGLCDTLGRMAGIDAGALHAELVRRGDLSSLDLRYRIRRLRFVARRLAILIDQDAAADYESLRRAVYASLSRYLERESKHFMVLPAHVDAQESCDLIAARWDLATLDAQTDIALAEAIGACPRVLRRAPLLAYLGFPFYDVATLALLQGEGFDEFDPVNVDRIAPEDAQSLSGTALSPLKGVQFNSFGAFFSRTYRENDYLWGRLHGAERFIDILVSTLPSDSLDAHAIAEAKARVFAAILDVEAARLTAVPELMAELRTRTSAMAGKARASRLD